MLTESGRSVINGFTVATVAALTNFYYPLRWFLLLAGVLIIVDLRFGLAAARKRGEKIRRSRAGRRTINKAVDYFCWITIAGILGQIFSYAWGGLFGITVADVPIAQLLLLVFIYLFEIDSCYANYCEARGICKRWNILKWVGKKTELEIEEADKKNNNQ